MNGHEVSDSSPCDASNVTRVLGVDVWDLSYAE